MGRPGSWEEHAGVIEAIERGDSEQLKGRMWLHCDRSRLGLITLDLMSSQGNVVRIAQSSGSHKILLDVQESMS
jgi:hypothetical protein